MKPLVTVVSPTHDREALLKERCIPSVQAQSYPEIEHVIVVDRNPELADRLAQEYPAARVYGCNDLWRSDVSAPSNGAWQWFLGTHLSRGEIICFIGDDDEYLPNHVALHVEALLDTGADYSLSKADFFVGGEYVFTVGDGKLKITHLDSDCIAARRETFRRANWRADGSVAPDYDLVFRWHQAGMKGAFVDEVTVKHHDGWLAGRPDIIEAARAGKDWRIHAGVIE